MADPKGFMTTPREVAQRRPVAERVHDWKEVYPESPGKAVLPRAADPIFTCARHGNHLGHDTPPVHSSPSFSLCACASSASSSSPLKR